jgi:hypothetical protein
MSEDKAKRRSLKQAEDEIAQKIDKVVASTNEALSTQGKAIDDTQEAVSALDEKLDKILLAINTPVAPKQYFEAMEQEHDSHGDAVDAESGIILESKGNPNSVEFKDKADNLAFMEEPVSVYIHESEDENAAPYFSIGVNGESRTFIRDTTMTVPRKFVEGLARARPMHFKNIEFTREDGTRAFRWPSKRTVRYPFSPVGDSRRGTQWLKKVLMEA